MQSTVSHLRPVEPLEWLESQPTSKSESRRDALHAACVKEQVLEYSLRYLDEYSIPKILITGSPNYGSSGDHAKVDR